MDALYFKIDHLKLLWAEYRVANEGINRDYSDQSEWAREKLQVVLTEFDKLIQEQILWKSKLAAEVEDLLVEIEEHCRLFGRRVDTVIPQAAALNVELNDSSRDKLMSIRDSLKEEIDQTRVNVKKWLTGLTTFVMELGEDYIVPSAEIFENDLSTSVVRPIWCKYDELIRISTVRRDAFEESAIKLHYYWDALHYTPQDEIDEALFGLFADKQNPKDIYEALQADLESKNNNSDSSQAPQESYDSPREYTYYTPQLPIGLKLSPEHLSILKDKLVIFEQNYIERRNRMNSMQKSVKNLYEELNIPLKERIELTDSLDEEYLDKLMLEFERLREIMRVIIQKAIEEYTVQLGELWDKCLVPQYEREEFFENLRKLVSAEEVYELLAQEVARLQELYAKCAKIYKWMLERRALIEKMIEFEKNASDPNRLFQSSFRLLEEEKWRKSCWPNLVKIEDQLINACIAYEDAERKPFMHESARYLDTLQSEISERIVNQMFFGFDKDTAKGSLSLKNQKQAKDSKNTVKRRDSQYISSRPVSPTASGNAQSRRNSKYIPSRPTSPTASGNAQSRRNSKYIPSRPASPTASGNSDIYQLCRSSKYIPSRPASPTASGNTDKSRRNSKYIPSRPASPTTSGNTDIYQSRRNSQLIPSRSSPSRPVSPANVTRTHRNNQAPKLVPSRAASPTQLKSVDNSSSRRKINQTPSRSVSPARSIASSRAVSPARPSGRNSQTLNVRRSSLYGGLANSTPTSPTFRTSKSSEGLSPSSRRSSLYIKNSDSSTLHPETASNHRASKSFDDNKHSASRHSLLGKVNSTSQRSNSVSSTSSESSSVSSVATPTTPEPSYVVNGRLGVPTKSKIKARNETRVAN